MPALASASRRADSTSPSARPGTRRALADGASTLRGVSSYAALPAPGSVLWLEQAIARDPGGPCPPLRGTERADVCIVGGGFVGLWTAVEVTRRAPDARVVLIDAETCGSGASGRNGGWVTGWFDELPQLVRRFGPDAGLALADRMSATIGDIGAFAAEHGIDCDYRQAGALWTASAPAQVGAWQEALEACRARGRGDRLELLSGEELRRRTGSPLPLAGVRQTDGAAIQPAHLARGLRRVLLERGVRIREATPMRRLHRGRPAVVETAMGRVEAGHVVLALGAWSAAIRELRRTLVPVGSQIVATEPVPERIARLGWTGGETFGDARLLVHYAQVSADGRIVFGRGGGAIGPAGRVLATHHRDPATVRIVAADFRRFFPSLADVRLTHAWGGPVDRAPGHLPWVGALGDAGTVHYAAGFSGNGVGPSALLARSLAARALDADDDDSRSPLVSEPPGYLPPEPFRTAGGALVRNAVRRAEAAEEAGRRPDPATAALRRLVWFTVPERLEPRARRRA